MRLLHVSTFQLQEYGTDFDHLPPYATLSHTWGVEEVTCLDLQDLANASHKAGFSKIKQVCNLALDKQIQYAWIDTCCIDKTSSAELSEAINSMYQIYRNSRICFVYLDDHPPGDSEDLFRTSRWFTRGWTLVELLAPGIVQFYDSCWNFLGEKSSQPLRSLISNITSIGEEILSDGYLVYTVSVAKRMSWAADRQTSRVEDIAYCLLGMFNVNMPLLYGEGIKAFLRLQQEILKTSTDMSIFAWKAECGTEQAYRGIFARSPAEFRHFRDLDFKPSLFGHRAEWTMSNKGLCVSATLARRRHGSQQLMDLGWIASITGYHQRVSILLLDAMGVFIRARPKDLFLFHEASSAAPSIIYISRDITSIESEALAPSYTPTMESECYSPLVWKTDPKTQDIDGYTHRQARSLHDLRSAKRTHWPQIPALHNDLWADSSVGAGCLGIPASQLWSEKGINKSLTMPRAPTFEDSTCFPLSLSQSGVGSGQEHECMLERVPLTEVAMWEFQRWLLCIFSRKDKAGKKGKAKSSLSHAVPGGTRKQRRSVEIKLHRKAKENEDLSLLKALEEEDRSLFACPYQVKGNRQYKDCLKACELITILDVKQHLFEKHQQPFYCPVCFETFKKTVFRDRHIISRSCQPRSRNLEGISNDQKKRLSKELDWQRPDIQQWYKIWDILFPDLKRPQTPFVNRSIAITTSMLRRFWRAHGLDLVISHLTSRGLSTTSSPGIMANMTSLSNVVLSDLMDMCLSDSETVLSACRSTNRFATSLTFTLRSIWK